MTARPRQPQGNPPRMASATFIMKPPKEIITPDTFNNNAYDSDSTSHQQTWKVAKRHYPLQMGKTRPAGLKWFACSPVAPGRPQSRNQGQGHVVLIHGREPARPPASEGLQPACSSACMSWVWPCKFFCLETGWNINLTGYFCH